MATFPEKIKAMRLQLFGKQLGAAARLGCTDAAISYWESGSRLPSPKLMGRLVECLERAGAWPHLSAPGNGLPDAPRPSDMCRFLVFEDFGTSGLTGDPEQLLPVENGDNRFFHFFRVEGRSDKHEHDRGRWGVGKQVFPRASRIRSVFGYTVRKDDRRRLLMGQAILKSHFVGSTCFQDGWFGRRRANERPVFPIEDGETLRAFRETFGVSRTDEP